jgi:hypothetical protein
MPDDAAIKYGILRCRDLSELYWDARTVVITKTNIIDPSSAPDLLFTADPRRIAWRIIVIDPSGPGEQQVDLGTRSAITAQTSERYYRDATEPLIIDRHFRDYGDYVTSELYGQVSGSAPLWSTVEWILTPLPADES